MGTNPMVFCRRNHKVGNSVGVDAVREWFRLEGIRLVIIEMVNVGFAHYSTDYIIVDSNYSKHNKVWRFSEKGSRGQEMVVDLLDRSHRDCIMIIGLFNESAVIGVKTLMCLRYVFESEVEALKYMDELGRKGVDAVMVEMALRRIP